MSDFFVLCISCTCVDEYSYSWEYVVTRHDIFRLKNLLVCEWRSIMLVDFKIGRSLRCDILTKNCREAVNTWPIRIIAYRRPKSLSLEKGSRGSD
jgi:hypothetical protein